MKTDITIQRELLRNAILLQLESASPVTLARTTLRQGIHALGHEVEETALRKELHYLEDKELLSRTRSQVSRGLERYRLTAAGRDYLEEIGLA